MFFIELQFFKIHKFLQWHFIAINFFVVMPKLGIFEFGSNSSSSRREP